MPHIDSNQQHRLHTQRQGRSERGERAGQICQSCWLQSLWYTYQGRWSSKSALPASLAAQGSDTRRNMCPIASFFHLLFRALSLLA